ncbi:MAG TPA: Ldh family oxidoreductase, partial [Tepidisphaeraceae bacterium]|nr:Ldh family oxidoreductase [Tepidisphaeraceae bacterium]
PAQALMGSVLTMAGHKGYALALLVECFAGVLSGSAIGSQIGSMYKDLDRKQNVGHFFCLLDIEAFMDVGEFKSRLDQTIDNIKALRKRPGVDEIFVPGERSYRTLIGNTKHGILLNSAVVNELQGLCRELGIGWPSNAELSTD